MQRGGWFLHANECGESPANAEASVMSAFCNDPQPPPSWAGAGSTKEVRKDTAHNHKSLAMAKNIQAAGRSDGFDHC